MLVSPSKDDKAAQAYVKPSLVSLNVQHILPTSSVPSQRIKLLFLLPLIVRRRLRPEFRCAQPKILMRVRLVPKDLILQFVRLRVVIDHETLIVLRTLIHDLTETIEVRKHPRELLVQLPTIADVGLA